MPQFSVNPHRFDPYKNFKFRLRMEGRYVAGLSRVSALRRTTEVVSHREGGDPGALRHSPGQTRYEPITLERGVTHDTAFEDWANKVHVPGAGPGEQVSLADFRRDLVLELHNEAGQIALAYRIYRAWVSEYTALADLDAQGNAVAIERIVLQNEGFERDTAITEPVEPGVEKRQRSQAGEETR